MIRAGLTGGIASGKTTVAYMFKDAGALVIDADQIARQVVMPGLPAWLAIRKCFGDRVLAPDGTVHRSLLAEKVFNDQYLRKKLEACVHPHVQAEMAAQMAVLEQASPQALLILDVPLLLETHMEEGLDEVIVVYAPPDIQMRRLMARDGLDRDGAQSRIDAQMPMEEKRRLATIIIDNGGDVAHTRRQTLKVYRDLSQRAIERA